MAAALGLTLAGCGSSSGSGSSAKDLTLTAWNGIPYEPFTSVNKKQLTACAATVGAKIKSQTFPADQLTPRVLQAGSAKSLPDLLYLDSSDLARVAGTGILTDLGDYGITGKGLDKSTLSLGQSKDVLYGITSNVNTLALYYNKAMFKEAGLQPPKTFAELRSAAKALTKGGRHGIALPGDSKGTGAYVFLPFVLSAGGDPKNMTDAGHKAALALWQGLVKDGSLSTDSVNWGWDAPDQFIGGKAAMTISGPWTIGNLKGSKVDYGVVTLPTLKPGASPVSPMGGEGWTVPVTDGGVRQETAAKVVKCMTDADRQLEMARAGQPLPALADVIKQIGTEHPEYAPFLAEIPGAYNRTSQLGELWDKRVPQYGSALQYALVGGSSPADALAKASNE
ncbi:sugar ABC transporter substrate-binding protein [Streptomyces sp.]|uniref:sugar ABC transporter substrate-binding protein n=1 Tax=Streptomyces sp. TaxID=1931 RepID=UPI002F40C61C